MEVQKTHIEHFLVIALVVALASAIILWVTANGLGIDPDSTIYIETAKNLLAGNGFYANGFYASSEPMTHYPPVYPLLLAMAGLFWPDIPHASRLLHAFLYAANAILFCLSIYICTKRNVVATVCAFLFFFSSIAILAVHSFALSEPPFIMFSLVTLVLLSLHLASPQLPLILAASAALSLAIATRYVGIALLPTMLLSLLLFGNRPLRNRVTDILITTLVAFVSISVWMIRNIMTAHTVANRTFTVHPIGLSHVKALIITLHDFILPASIPASVKAMNLVTITGVLLLTLAILYRQHRIKLNTASVDMILSSLGVMFSMGYIALVFVSISFFDANTQIDDRIFLPVFVFLTISAISLASALSHTLRKTIIWWGFILCVLVLIGINGIRVTKAAIYMHTNGIGYNSRQWNESMTLSLLKSFGQTLKIYSNGPDVIHFKIDRNAILIPIHIFAGTRNQNRNYQAELQAMCKECTDGKAIVVYLNRINRWYLPTERELKLACELPVLSQTEDGTVYGKR